MSAGNGRAQLQRLVLETRHHPEVRGVATGLGVGALGALRVLPRAQAVALGAAAGLLHRHIASAEGRVSREARNARDAANLVAYSNAVGGAPSFFGGYAIEPDFARLIVREIEAAATTVVECGSGSSTVLIASLLRRRGEGKVYAIEDDEQHARSTAARLEEAGLGDWGHVIHAPLRAQRFGLREINWYDSGVVERSLPDTRIDLLVVDGPHGEGEWARWPAVGVFHARLADRSTVLLDDGRRRGERRTAARWASDHPELELYWVDTTAGAWRLVRTAAPPSRSPRVRALHTLAQLLNPMPAGHTMPVRR